MVGFLVAGKCTWWRWKTRKGEALQNGIANIKNESAAKQSNKQEAIDEITSGCKMMSETLKREKVRKGERMDAC